jgi:Terpene synthase family 2, C-terminal metal binding
MNNRWNGASVIPDMNEYLVFRRELSGFAMVLDLLELTENMSLPSMDTYFGEKMIHLKNLALDIICCSLVRNRRNFFLIRIID